ncbi:MAG TPA: biotin transporter BioY [Peptococcaceae bacterium]|nr:MAG: BioY protein [Moorella sp. 60_41]HBT46897.1 biotin transporter BioY [Peptococcaceae bacterium]
MKAKEMSWVALFAALIAVLAQVSITLPFTPVPLTGQTLGVFLAGVVLGRRLGAMAVLVYLLLGAAGLPVFARGGAGIARFFGPTGGYLWGFLAGVYLQGWITGSSPRLSYLRAAGGMVVCLAAVYGLGVLQLAYLMKLPLSKALAMGVLPYVPLDLAKLVLAALVGVRVRRALGEAGLLPLPGEK